MWILAIVVLVGLWALVVYNGLIQLRVQADNAWSDIGIQLKRRYDLIPNVVETVKGYAAHERGVLEAVTQARSHAMQAADPAGKGAAEQALASTLKSLFAVAENYPQLRANENFMGLQQSLTQVEEALQGARRYYNAVVRDYNIKLTVVPDRVVAQMGGFRPREFFQLESPDEAKAPRVSFS